MAIEKLKQELAANENNQVPAGPIVDYLIKAVKLSDELAIAIKQEDKTLEKCFDHVLEKVKEKLNSRSGYVQDQEVYDMACSYYLGKNVNIVIDNTGTELDIKADEVAEKNEQLQEKDNKIKELEEKIRSIQEDNTQEVLAAQQKEQIEAETNKELQEKDNKIKELEERIKSIQESNKKEALDNVNKETKKKVKKSSKKNSNIEGQISLF